MAIRSRLAGLAAAAALALPAAALIAALPGTAAQASTDHPSTACSVEQATINFANGTSHCQSYGRVTYIALKDDERISSICTSTLSFASIFPQAIVRLPVMPPNTCQTVNPYPKTTDVVIAVLPF
jgi:hypothetical protein